jgi:hypothetical protein
MIAGRIDFRPSKLPGKTTFDSQAILKFLVYGGRDGEGCLRDSFAIGDSLIART